MVYGSVKHAMSAAAEKFLGLAPRPRIVVLEQTCRARLDFALDYCTRRGWIPGKLTDEQVTEIQSQRAWIRGK
jgi:hypothetical protein